MIIRNATFSMSYSKGGGNYGGEFYDADYSSEREYAGFPKRRERQWSGSKRIPCQVVPIEEETVSYTSASGKTVFNGRYMILVEARHLKGEISQYNRIHNMKIGIFMDGGNGYGIRTTGVSIEYLRAVNQYKILCR